jgi:hypothetical protein
MISTILLCVSIVSLGQFGFYYWRTMMISISALPVSDRIRVAAGIAAPAASSRDFRAILSVYDMVPDLRGCSTSLRAIRVYYSVVEKVGRLIPPIAKWSEAETTNCSRYAAVLLDQHLERNLACAAQVRGF